MEQEDNWHVQMESGEVRLLSLDQLDGFYQNGIIDEQTYVLRDGEMEWRKLGEVLGLDDQPEPFAAAPSPTPSPVSYNSLVWSDQPIHQSIRPVVSEIDVDELDDMAFKKSGKAKYVAIGAVGLALAGMAAFVGASRMGHSPSAAQVQAAMVEATPPPAVTNAAPPVLDPSPVVAPKLTDDAKKALADKDAQFNQKQDEKRQARVRNAPAPHKKSSNPLSKNGNAYDPLNSKL